MGSWDEEFASYREDFYAPSWDQTPEEYLDDIAGPADTAKPRVRTREMPSSLIQVPDSWGAPLGTQTDLGRFTRPKF